MSVFPWAVTAVAVLHAVRVWLLARKATATATRAARLAVDMRRDNKTLQQAVVAWRRRAVHWQARAETAEHDHNMAMLNTPYAETLMDVWGLPDTRERTR